MFENLDDLDLDLKLIDLKSIDFMSYFKSKFLIFFKLFKQIIWIVITQIQIQMPKSCHPNTDIKIVFLMED